MNACFSTAGQGYYTITKKCLVYRRKTRNNMYDYIVKEEVFLMCSGSICRRGVYSYMCRRGVLKGIPMAVPAGEECWKI